MFHSHKAWNYALKPTMGQQDSETSDVATPAKSKAEMSEKQGDSAEI